DAAGGARFGMFRFGYIDAPFTITPGDTIDTQQRMIKFRGEDNRHFVPPPPNNWFPHFPYNELPQPTSTNHPASPLLPLHTNVDQNGIRSSDIPREPTSNDFPGQSYLFRDGELAVATFRSDFQTAEAVYRKKLKDWNKTWYDMDLLIGLKWVNTNERF